MPHHLLNTTTYDVVVDTSCLACDDDGDAVLSGSSLPRISASLGSLGEADTMADGSRSAHLGIQRFGVRMDHETSMRGFRLPGTYH